MKRQQAQMQQGAQQQQQQQAQAQQQKEMEASILQQILDPQAFERLQRLKLVKGDKVQRVIDNLVGRAKSGQLREQISDAALVEILGDAGASERAVTVTSMRKRNAFDEDEEEADDY
jgi:programmed cell death protein 5